MSSFHPNSNTKDIFSKLPTDTLLYLFNFLPISSIRLFSSLNHFSNGFYLNPVNQRIIYKYFNLSLMYEDNVENNDSNYNYTDSPIIESNQLELNKFSLVCSNFRFGLDLIMNSNTQQYKYWMGLTNINCSLHFIPTQVKQILLLFNEYLPNFRSLQLQVHIHPVSNHTNIDYFDEEFEWLLYLPKQLLSLIIMFRRYNSFTELEAVDSSVISTIGLTCPNLQTLQLFTNFKLLNTDRARDYWTQFPALTELSFANSEWPNPNKFDAPYTNCLVPFFSSIPDSTSSNPLNALSFWSKHSTEWLTSYKQNHKDQLEVSLFQTHFQHLTVLILDEYLEEVRYCTELKLLQIVLLGHEESEIPTKQLKTFELIYENHSNTLIGLGIGGGLGKHPNLVSRFSHSLACLDWFSKFPCLQGFNIDPLPRSLFRAEEREIVEKHTTKHSFHSFFFYWQKFKIPIANSKRLFIQQTRTLYEGYKEKAGKKMQKKIRPIVTVTSTENS